MLKSVSDGLARIEARADFARRVEQCLYSLLWMGFLHRDPVPGYRRLMPPAIRPLHFQMTLRCTLGEISLCARGRPGIISATRGNGPALGVQWLICERLPAGASRQLLGSSCVAYSLAEAERRMAEAASIFDACAIGRLRLRLGAQRHVHPGAYQAGSAELRGYEAMVLGCFPELTAALASPA